MEIAAGSRLGPYEIVSRLGAGGMGEVWRATDTRLDRAVAIKLLPAEYAQNSQLKVRFEREAKTISQLHHPHICTLFDVGHEQGHDFLVMELIEGESLAERLMRGPLPIEQALRYAIEIADALSKAHRHGIVHRDLKPGNVMITSSGAKLLDFGLAKHSLSASSGIFSGTTAVVMPTEQKPLTAEGTIVGTLQYMAPEQLEGTEADARTDVFAFGALVYEMVTGKRAFEGRTKTSLIAAIVDRDPQPMSTVMPGAPAPLERVVAVCLRKEPNDRWQSAHDVKLELEAIAAGASASAIHVRSQRQSRTGWIVAGVIALAALALGVAWWRTRRPVEAQRFMIAPPPKASFDLEDAPPVVSPDGRNVLLYIHTEAGDELVVRPTNSFEYRKLHSGVYDPIWSPDGRYVAFFKDAKLKRISVNGGAAQTIVGTGDSRGASWGTSDTIVYAPGPNSPIFAVPAQGGTARAVTKLDASRKEGGHWRPFFLPDGRHFLFTAHSSEPDFVGVWCGSIDSFERKRVLDRDTTVIYADGHLLYTEAGDLYALKFDPEKIATIGEPFVVAKNVSYSPQYGSAGYSAGGGTLMYQISATALNPPLARFDRHTRLRSILPNFTGINLDLSRDGTRIGYQHTDPEHNTPDIWVGDLTRGSATRITSDAAPDIGPVWSPDSRVLIYVSFRNGNTVLLRKLATGAGPEEVLDEYPPSGMIEGAMAVTEIIDWTRDGKYLIAELSKPGEGQNIGRIDAAAPKHSLAPLVSTMFNEQSARISSDGRWLAYVSAESGTRQIYVEPFPPTGARMQVSVDGGDSPRWRGDGRELFFVDRDHTILAVQVTPHGAELEFSRPEPVIDGVSNDYVVTSDGNTFYSSLQRPNIADPVYVVTNWTAGR